MSRLKAYREASGLKAKDFVYVVNQIYPKYDKHLHSKVENDQCGIRLREDAEDALKRFFNMPDDVFDLDVRRDEKTIRREIRRKLSVRLTESEFDELQQHIKSDGYETMQAFLFRLIHNYLKRKRKSALPKQDAKENCQANYSK